MPIPAAHQPPKAIPQTTPPAPDFNPQPDPPLALNPASGASMMDTQHSTHGDSYAYSYPSYPAFYDAWVEDMFSPPSPSELSKVKKNEDIPIFEELIRVRLTENEVSGQDRIVNIVDLGTGTGRVVCELFRRRLSSSFLKGPQTRQSNTQLRIWGVDHSTSMLSTAAENFAKYITPESHSTLEPPIWIRASASEFLTTLQAASGGVAEGEIDFLFLSVGTIHHLIHPGEVLSFLKELGRGLRAVTGRAVISVLDEMVPDKDEEAKKVDAVKYTKAENQIIRRKGRRGELYVKSPTVTSTENQEVEVDIGDGVRMTVNSEIRCDRWVVEFYDNLPADWEREASSLAQMIAEGMGRKVWTKEMEWSLALWDENVFHKLIHVAGLKVVEVKKGGFQRWYILGKLGKQ